MKIPIEINLDDIIESINKDDSLDLILALDAKRGDCDFTLNLLKELIKSLETDMSRQDIGEWHDDHPLNNGETYQSEYLKLFGTV